MKIFQVHCLLLIFLIPALGLASTPQQVSEWTENALSVTLIAGHHETISEATNTRRLFKHDAWLSMETFFQHYIEFTQGKQRLTFQPTPLTPAIILSPEVCYATSCWTVHQAFLVPELDRIINFTALVGTAPPSYPSPFMIHSLNIVVSPY